MAQWKHEYSEPPIDLRVFKPEQDWRVPVDEAIRSLDLEKLQEILDGHGREADYLIELDNAAILNSRLTTLMLICSLVRERGRLRRMEAAE